MAIVDQQRDNRIDLTGDVRRRRREAVVKALFFGAAAISILISVAIVLALIGKAWAFVTSIELNQLWGNGWFPRRGRFDLAALIVHTLMVTGVAMVVAVPFGLGSAIYLSEYARSGVRRVLKPTLEILAGIPSVVLGFFALQFITPNIVRGLFPGSQSANFLAAGIAVGILIIPLVASVSEDAMRAVPNSLREASYGLGAKQWHTVVTGGLPGRDLRHHRRRDPGHISGGWRNHGRGLGCRSQRHHDLQPDRGWAHHDRCHRQPGGWLGSGGRGCRPRSSHCSSSASSSSC